MLSLATPTNNQVLATKRASGATNILTKVDYLNCSPWHFKIEPLWYLIHKQAELTGYSVTVWLETSSGTLRLASSSWQSGRNQKLSSRAFCLENSSGRRHRPVRCALQVLLHSPLRVFVNCVVSCKFSYSVYREFRQVIKDSSRSGPRVDFHTRHTGLRRLRSWITVPKTGNPSCSSCKLQTSPSRCHFLLTLHVHFLPRGRPERSSPRCCLFVYLWSWSYCLVSAVKFCAPSCWIRGMRETTDWWQGNYYNQ